MKHLNLASNVLQQASIRNLDETLVSTEGIAKTFHLESANYLCERNPCDSGADEFCRTTKAITALTFYRLIRRGNARLASHSLYQYSGGWVASVPIHWVLRVLHRVIPRFVRYSILSFESSALSLVDRQKERPLQLQDCTPKAVAASPLLVPSATTAPCHLL